MTTEMFNNMFVLSIPILEKILRPIIIYFVLIIGLRLAGKRELAQLNPFDLVVLLTLSNTVQNSIIGPDNSVTGGIIGAATLLAVNYIVVRFLYDHHKIEKLVEGDADVLVKNGKIRLDRMKKEIITQEEIESAAHKQGFASLDDVEQAVLEPGGAVSFIGKKPAPDALRHQEILDKLDRITRELEQLKTRQAS
jgi:uncharacterized membrane protein YcaP (DUF421 family)